MNPDIVNGLLDSWIGEPVTPVTIQNIVNSMASQIQGSIDRVEVSEDNGQLTIDAAITRPTPIPSINIQFERVEAEARVFEQLVSNQEAKPKEVEIFTWFGGFIYNKTYEPNIIVSDNGDFWICIKKTYGEFSPYEGQKLRYPPWRRAKHEEIFHLLDLQKNISLKSTVNTETKTRAIKI
jgi:hypothetical protein